MRRLELRRHAPRLPDVDALSSDGEILAERVGATLEGPYDALFVSPKKRTAQTAAWFLRGLKHSLPQRHGVVEGLSPDDGAVAEALRLVVSDVPDETKTLLVGHTPSLEEAVETLTGTTIQPLRECEGVLLVENDGEIRVEREYRLS